MILPALIIAKIYIQEEITGAQVREGTMADATTRSEDPPEEQESAQW